MNITRDWRSILNSFFESFALKCPKCGKGKIFSSYIKISPEKKCSSCSLKFSDFDIGDGPAYVAVFFICFLIPILALIVEVIYQPDFITHAILWTISTILFTYLILIYSRSAFIHLEYKIRQLEKRK